MTEVLRELNIYPGEFHLYKGNPRPGVVRIQWHRSLENLKTLQIPDGETKGYTAALATDDILHKVFPHYKKSEH